LWKNRSSPASDRAVSTDPNSGTRSDATSENLYEAQSPPASSTALSEVTAAFSGPIAPNGPATRSRSTTSFAPVLRRSMVMAVMPAAR
jgi:hypothetical protein